MSIIPSVVTSKFSVAALQASKHGPAVMVGAGIVGVVGTAVLASRATLKVIPVVEESVNIMGAIDIAEREGALENGEEYTHDDAVKDRVKVVIKTGVQVGKIYGPTVLVGAATIGLFVGSHNILNKRNAALTAAYGAVSKAFKEYRGRVREEYGEEIEAKIYHDLEEKTSTATVDGKKVKTKSLASKGVNNTPYGKWYDDSCVDWSPEPSINVMWLRAKQAYLNDRLNARGFMFLNDAYRELGMPTTKAGQVVGWLSEKYRAGNGDGYIDFGILDEENMQLHEYMVGKDDRIFVDFNVDGVILDSAYDFDGYAIH